MQFKKIGSKYVVRLDKGEEVVSTLKQFCEDNKIKLGTIQGIGATNQATVGLFHTQTKEYHTQKLMGDHEITNLTGNISTKDGEVYLHIHINLANTDYHTFGGHLSEALVSATCELMIDVIEGEVERAFNDEVGLNLYQFE
ncbi:DNA-binding protein [Clostridiaceae bacterium 35-E11]